MFLFFPFFVLLLFLAFLFADTITNMFIALVLLLLKKYHLLEGTDSFLAGGRSSDRGGRTLPVSLLLDTAYIELEYVDFSLDIVQPLKVSAVDLETAFYLAIRGDI